MTPNEYFLIKSKLIYFFLFEDIDEDDIKKRHLFYFYKVRCMIVWNRMFDDSCKQFVQ